MSTLDVPLGSFETFGDLLKFLRRREHLTQLELSIKVGYSEAQISRLEQNQRLPDPAALTALFVPALHLEKEAKIMARLVDLAKAARQEVAPAPGIAPYKGLLYFDVSDSHIFFGREALTLQLVAHINDLARDASSRFLAIVGASGCGKSSLVRAGLVVALQRAGWSANIFTPTASPLAALATHYNPLEAGNSNHHLILVDQFEETFTLCRDEKERTTFIETLLGIASDQTANTTVAIAMRSDFYLHCAKYPNLREAVATQQEHVGQMSREDLRRAILQPARQGGWEFEPGLVDVLLGDAGMHGMADTEPGALPLLSHALLATWERRRGRKFTIDGYHASGGVRGAIAETAESVFTDQLNRAQQDMARDIFLRLTELGEATEDTRRRVALNELVHREDEALQVRAVLNILADARLITLNEDSAEVAHEALIREWERLRGWLAQNREGLRMHRHLTNSAHEWERRGYDPADLYRGARLAQVREWISEHEERLNRSEHAFIAASMEQEQRESKEREARERRELGSAMQAARAEQRRAEEQTHYARRLRDQARFLAGALILSVVLAGSALSFSNQSVQNAQAAVQAHATVLANADSTAKLIDAMMGTEFLPLSERTDPTSLVAYSADGKMVATRMEQYSIIISDAGTGNQLFTLAGHTYQVTDIAFSPDGTRLASSSADGTAILWDLSDGKALFMLKGHSGSVESVDFSPDGRFLLTSGDTTVIIWDAISGRLMRIISGAIVLDAVYSPDGARIATANLDGTTKIWDASTGKELLNLSGYSLAVLKVAFSPDGKWLVSVNADGTARVWDTTTGELMLEYVR